MKNGSRIDSGRAILWASAFVIAALVLVQAGRLNVNPAYADGISQGSGYTLVALDSGRGGEAQPDEVLVVIDSNAEVVMLYEVDSRNRAIVPRDGGLLPGLFRRALNR